MGVNLCSHISSSMISFILSLVDFSAHDILAVSSYPREGLAFCVTTYIYYFMLKSFSVEP